jgi:hypothetical protein
MVNKKGFSAADVANGGMIFMVIVIVFSVLYWYLTFHARTELFTTVSQMNEYSYYSTAEKIFLKNAARYSFEQASQEVLGDDLSKLEDEATKNAMEERFKVIFDEYLSDLTKRDARITNSPKIENVSFDVQLNDLYVRLDNPIILGQKDSYVLVNNEIYCNKCIR